MIRRVFHVWFRNGFYFDLLSHRGHWRRVWPLPFIVRKSYAPVCIFFYGIFQKLFTLFHVTTFWRRAVTILCFYSVIYIYIYIYTKIKQNLTTTKRVRNRTTQYKSLHKRYNTKHTDRTATTLYDSKGGGGGRRKSRHLCDRRYELQMRVNLNLKCASKHRIS